VTAIPANAAGACPHRAGACDERRPLPRPAALLVRRSPRCSRAPQPADGTAGRADGSGAPASTGSSSRRKRPRGSKPHGLQNETPRSGNASRVSHLQLRAEFSSPMSGTGGDRRNGYSVILGYIRYVACLGGVDVVRLGKRRVPESPSGLEGEFGSAGPNSVGSSDGNPVQSRASSCRSRRFSVSSNSGYRPREPYHWLEGQFSAVVTLRQLRSAASRVRHSRPAAWRGVESASGTTAAQRRLPRESCWTVSSPYCGSPRARSSGLPT
jgi:hypothetical protein